MIWQGYQNEQRPPLTLRDNGSGIMEQSVRTARRSSSPSPAKPAAAWLACLPS